MGVSLVEAREAARGVPGGGRAGGLLGTADTRLPRAERAAFHLALTTLNRGQVPFVIGGALAVSHHTGLWRDTADLDLFLLPADVARALAALRRAGFRTRVTEPGWLAQAVRGPAVVELAHGLGNLLATVDQTWLARGEPALLLGVPARLVAPEELIWSKAYVAGRGRFDGADVAHLLLRTAARLDWDHLIARFGDHADLLLAYLALFQFVYPDDRQLIPAEVLATLTARQRALLAAPPPAERVCRGPLLDRTSFEFDLREHGYHDPRRSLREPGEAWRGA